MSELDPVRLGAIDGASDSDQDDAHPFAAGILYRAAGRVLLLKRAQGSTNAGTWGFPAGKIDAGETPLEAAIRESDEETSHKPTQDLKTLDTAGGFVLYLCECDQFPVLLNEEHDGYVWASPEDLPQPLHPAVAQQIEMSAMDKSAREYDINGWATVSANPLSKVGVYPYGGNQLPGAPDKARIYQVYRPAEELADPECIASFKLLPWIDNHVMLGAEAKGLTPAEKKGVQGVIGEDIYFEAPFLYGNLKVFSQSLADLIEAGKRELSCGYRCVYEWTSGEFEGQPYDCIQRKIRGNHIALVESGRMGPEVSVLDGSALDQFTFTIDQKDFDMAEEDKGGESTSMSLEDAVKAVAALMPALKLIQEHAAAQGAAEVDPAAGVDLEDPAKVADPEEKPVGAKDVDVLAEKKDEDAPKKEDEEGKAMDAKLDFKCLMAQIAKRDALAKSLSEHVGTFDHSLMTEAEVAAYGVQKLGLKAPKGQASAMLAGFLQAKPAPRTQAIAQDAKTVKGDSFITRHYAAKKEA